MHKYVFYSVPNMRINAVKWVLNMRSQKLSKASQFFSENILSGILESTQNLALETT